MLNHKGQSLVLFILIIPILLGMMALVYDVGQLFVAKNNLSNVIEMVLNCELDLDKEERNQEEIEQLLDYNLTYHDSHVTMEEEKIKIQTSSYVKGIFSKILGFSGFKIESEYIGYKDNEKKKIEKIK